MFFFHVKMLSNTNQRVQKTLQNPYFGSFTAESARV